MLRSRHDVLHLVLSVLDGTLDVVDDVLHGLLGVGDGP